MFLLFTSKDVMGTSAKFISVFYVYSAHCPVGEESPSPEEAMTINAMCHVFYVWFCACSRGKVTMMFLQKTIPMKHWRFSL